MAKQSDVSFRCDVCLTSWPAHEEFSNCPRVGCEDNETDAIGYVKPDYTLKEAKSIKKNELFKKFYAEWDATQDPDRLKTDGLREELSVPSSELE